MLDGLPTEVHMLDAGAGIGSLCAALLEDLCTWERPPDSVSLSAYEIDTRLLPMLEATLGRCDEALGARGIRRDLKIRAEDFIASAVTQLCATVPQQRFNCALVNPPYRKIRSDSPERRLL